MKETDKASFEWKGSGNFRMDFEEACGRIAQVDEIVLALKELAQQQKTFFYPSPRTARDSEEERRRKRKKRQAEEERRRRRRHSSGFLF